MKSNENILYKYFITFLLALACGLIIHNIKITNTPYGYEDAQQNYAIQKNKSLEANKAQVALKYIYEGISNLIIRK